MTLSVGKEGVTMREIKFRAWERPDVPAPRGYAENKNFNGAMHYDIQDATYFGDWLHDEGYIVMQYTGLKDKNGKEIYEGDLLREEAEDVWEQDNFMAQEVFWHDNNEADHHIGWQMNRVHFQGNLSGSSVWNTLLPKYTEKMYVIGNIYENKELL